MGKIIITGASGFIGSNFLKYLGNESQETLEKIILISSGSIEGYTCVDRNKPDWMDILGSLLGGEKPEIVYHLGSYTPKSGNEANDLAGSNANISFTYSLIGAIPPPNRLIFTSTLDVYNFKNKVNEGTTPAPSTLYAHSKLYCERMLEVWAAINEVNLQILRVGHVYGEGEGNYKKLIPVTIEACLSGRNPTLYTSGDEFRSFIYIFDLCRMIHKSATFKKETGLLNLVGFHPMKVKEVVQEIIRQINPDLSITFNNQSSGLSTEFDNSKMIELLGTSFTPIQEGLKNEIAFMKFQRSVK